jgi:hypothetical protein
MLGILLAFACAPLDEEACLAIEADAECPSEADASDVLVGEEICGDPVRVVTRTGALVDRIDCGEGAPGEDCCCYEAHLRDRHGEACIAEGATR